MIPRLRIIAGPNGSGKTTITQSLLKKKYITGAYINADEILTEWLGAEFVESFDGVELKERRFFWFATPEGFVFAGQISLKEALAMASAVISFLCAVFYLGVNYSAPVIAFVSAVRLATTTFVKSAMGF